MSNRKKSAKRARVYRSDEYKIEALKLADTVGVTAAAEQLGLQTSQLYAWRMKFRRIESTSEAERRLQEENTALKRQLAEKKMEADLPDRAPQTPSGDR